MLRLLSIVISCVAPLASALPHDAAGGLAAALEADAVPAASGTRAAQDHAQEPALYDEKADARKVLGAALARAKKDNQRVLIQWGANWCGWCHLLHGAMTENADVRQKLVYEYRVVHVDVGRFDKHLDLAKELGLDAIPAIPYLTVLDADGKTIVHQNTEPFEVNVDGKQGHDPAKLVTFLSEHQAPPLEADAVRAAALARAKTEAKRVFLHYGAPWCGWCHRLEEWMERPEVAPLLAKEFVDLKIDTERMLGGEEMLAADRAAARSADSGGIPWIVLLDADGNAVATGDGPNGNVGFPYQDEEIAHFVAMLERTCKVLGAEDVAVLKKSLETTREEIEARRKAAEASSGR